MSELAPLYFGLLAQVAGLIGFGAIESHLVHRHGYLYAFTIGIFESFFGALLVAIATYVICRLGLFAYDLLTRVWARIGPPKAED